ncbi:hypothetical protein FJY90_06730 [Candidatus Gottesmanbacteria bacterium]|nr:hypothetical protein [Candidatus Gottesmanbacteria bacterium]
MSLQGLALCSRFSYPPNSLSLCGPEKKRDLNYYSLSGKTDKGTSEILSQFSTLYPYLQLIAQNNNIKDPFDTRVVEAYWLGNEFLSQIPMGNFIKHLRDSIQLSKKIKRAELELIFGKVSAGALPHHAFHVLNIYKRTGNIDAPYALETMDACLINWGQVKKVIPGAVIIETKPLRSVNHKLGFGPSRQRTVMAQGEKDTLFAKMKEGDWISYHWGYFCQKLSFRQLQNLIHHTNLSLSYANSYLLDFHL